MAEAERTLTVTGAGQIVPVAGRPLEQNPAAVYLAHLAPGSRRTMRQALDAIAHTVTSGRCDAFSMPWAQLRYQHTQAIRAALAEQHKPATANKALSALRQVLKEAWRLGQMSAEDYQRAADLESVRGSSLPKGRALSAGEVEALFRACAADTSPAGARDAALLAVLYAGGLRRSEAVRLDVGDFDVQTGALTVREGKGKKDRTAYAENGAATYLVDWILARGTEDGALFCPVNKGGRVILRRMTSQAVWNALAKRAKQAGVKRFTPHDLRRTFISDLLDKTGDVSAVQRLAGHANVSTTLRYDRRPEAAKRKAAGLLHVPYFARE